MSDDPTGLDTTLRGRSPYDLDGIHPIATPIKLPRLPFPWRRSADGHAVDEDTMDAWLATDPSVVALRNAGQWGDQQDRVAKFSPWLRQLSIRPSSPAQRCGVTSANSRRGKSMSSAVRRRWRWASTSAASRRCSTPTCHRRSPIIANASAAPGDSASRSPLVSRYARTVRSIV